MVKRRDALAARRAVLGFTQEGLAHDLGVELSTVGRWERGTLTPQPWRRPDLAAALKLSLEELDDLLKPTAMRQNALHSEPARLPSSTIRSADHLDEVMSHLREQWHALVRTDNLLGPRFALSAVREHITIIEELLSVSPASRRGGLLTLAATYAESAAWLYEDAGQFPAATYWVGRAMEWATEAGDDLLVAWTLFRRSQHAAAGGDARRTISLTRSAGKDGDRLPNPMRAAIVQQEAHGYALAGDELMSHRTLDIAHQWAAFDIVGDARGGHGSFCSETYLELQRAQCWTTLRKPHRAVQVYEATLPSLQPVYRRDRGIACGRLARAYAEAGQPEAAAQLGREALAIARDSGSVRSELEVALVGSRLEKHRRLQPVDELLAELSAPGTA